MKKSERVEPVTVPGLDLESGDFGGSWYARDLAYGADSLIENLAGELDGRVDLLYFEVYVQGAI